MAVSFIQTGIDNSKVTSSNILQRRLHVTACLHEYACPSHLTDSNLSQSINFINSITSAVANSSDLKSSAKITFKRDVPVNIQSFFKIVFDFNRLKTGNN